MKCCRGSVLYRVVVVVSLGVIVHRLVCESILNSSSAVEAAFFIE